MSGKGLLGFVLAFVLLFSVGLASASCGDGTCDNDGVSVTLYENEPQIVTVGGVNYDVELEFVSASSAIIRVGNESRAVGGYNLMVGGIIVFVEDDGIHYFDRVNMTSYVDVILGENEVSCPQDCNQTLTCTDSDGGYDYHTKGTVTWDGHSVTDVCLNSQVVLENFCDGNTPSNDTYSCPYGCSDGACLNQTCTDSDGGMDYLVKGTCTDSTGTYADDCFGSNGVNDWHCVNAVCTKSGISDCSAWYGSGYTCSDGACISAANSSCTGDKCTLYVNDPVTVTIGTEDAEIEAMSISSGSVIVKVNEVTSSALAEGASTVLAGFTIYVNDIFYSSTGASYVILTPSKTTTSCSDSDGGKDYYAKGYLYTCSCSFSILGGSCGCTPGIQDSCLNEDALNEGYCDGGTKKWEKYTCQYGCEDGACLISPGPPANISVPSVWSDKNYYTQDEEVTIYAKVVDSDGTPAEPSEGASVTFYVAGTSYEGPTEVFTMEYNNESGYYEKTIKPVSTGTIYVYVTATKGGQSVTNSEYYFKVISQERFMKCAIFRPSDRETVEGTVKIHANAKSDKKIDGMKLTIKGEDEAAEIPLNDCTGTTSSGGVYYMDCYYSWDTRGYQGRVELVLTAWNMNGEKATHSINVYVSEGEGFISAMIDSPRDGETVSGTQNIRVTAKSSSELEEISLAIESGNTGIAFPLKDCIHGITACIEGEACKPVYSMICSYQWDTTYYTGKKVTLRATARNNENKRAYHTIGVYVGRIGKAWTREEVMDAFKDEWIAKEYGMKIDSKKGEEILESIDPVIEAPVEKIVEAWKKYWILSSEEAGLYRVILEDGSGSEPKQGEYLAFINSRVLDNEEMSWPSGVISLEKAEGIIIDELGLEKFETGEAELMVILYRGVSTTAASLKTEIPSAGGSGGGGSAPITGMITSSGGGAGAGGGPATVPSSGGAGGGGGVAPSTVYSKTCTYVWDSTPYVNQAVEITANIRDEADSTASDSIIVNIVESIGEGAGGSGFGGKALDGRTLDIQITEPYTNLLEAGEIEMGVKARGPKELEKITLIFKSDVEGSGAAVIDIPNENCVSTATGAGGGSGGGGEAISPYPIRQQQSYWVIKGTGIKSDGSTTKLEILMDAKTGEILVGPTPGIEDTIRKQFEQAFSQLGLKIAQIRQVSWEELTMAVREIRDMCDKVGPLDQGGTYWLVSDTEGVIKIIIRQGRILQPVVIKRETTPTSIEIKESISEAEAAASISAVEIKPATEAAKKEAVPITGAVVASNAGGGGGVAPSSGSGGGGGGAVPLSVSETEITPVLMIFDVNKLAELPGLNDYARQQILDAQEKSEEAIKGDLGADELKLYDLNMVMLYRTSYCPACPEGKVCEPCVASSMEQFVYAKGLTGGESPVKFAYVLNYPEYDIRCKKTSGIDKGELNVNLWVSKKAVSPGDSVIVRSKVTDYQGNPVPNAKLALTMGLLGGIYTCPACEVPADVKANIASEMASTGIAGGYACKPCVYEEEVIQTIVGETDENGVWTYMLKIANIKSGEYRLELKAEKGESSGYDKTVIMVKNMGPVENRTFETIDLVRIVLKLETMNINILKLKPTAQAIANYYSSAGETEKAQAWQAVVANIDAISAHITDVKKAIKDLVDNPSEEKLIAVKGEVVKVKSEIEDLLLQIIRVV